MLICHDRFNPDVCGLVKKIIPDMTDVLLDAIFKINYLCTYMCTRIIQKQIQCSLFKNM